MSSEADRRLDIHAKGLIHFYGEKSSRANNFADEPVCPVESTTFFYQLDENEVIRCCALLSYQLRLKYNVVYAFQPHEMHADQQAQFQLFNRISCFTEYLDVCKSFIVCFRRCSDHIAEKLSRESALRNTVPPGRKRQSDGTVINDEEDDAYRELKSVYEQMQNMKKMFDGYFSIFDGNDFDRYLIYEKIYLDTCLSADLPLTMQLADFTDLPTLFSTLMRLTLIATDFANTQFSAFFGTGLLLIMLLYLTSDEVLHDVNTVTLADNPRDRGLARSHWTRLTLLNPDDRHAACLLRDINSEAYHRAIATLPPEDFAPHLGHVYMSKGDTLATLFLQFNARLFLRIYEWPERRDVKSHLIDKYVCDNIASYFLKSGRGRQHAWIKFFRRKRDKETALSTAPAWQHVTTDNGAHNDNGEAAGTASFSLPVAQTITTPENLPQIFINIAALHALYDALARGVKKNNSKRKRMDGNPNRAGPLDPASASTVIAADNAEVQRSWQTLDAFKQSYVSFFVNGCPLRPHFRAWYQNQVQTFLLRSGGYRGFCHRDHPRVFYFDNDLSHVYSPDCEECTASLYSYCSPDTSQSIFSLAKWAKEIHALLFPYNFLLISASFLKNNQVLNDNDLRDAWVLKAQELLVSHKFTADKCLKCHAYFCDLEKRCRLIVEEEQLKHFFMSAMETLPFIRDLMDIDDKEWPDDNL